MLTNILAHRGKRLRKKTGDSNFLSKSESCSSQKKNWITLTVYHLTMPFRITFLDPSIGFINLYTGLIYGVYYSFFESFPLVCTFKTLGHCLHSYPMLT